MPSFSITAAGVTPAFSLKPGQSATLSVAGTFTGFVNIERSDSPASTYETLQAGAEDTEFVLSVANDTKGDLWYRFRGLDTDSETPMTGAAVCTAITPDHALAVGAGAPSGATVTAEETVHGLIHKTVLRLESTPVSIVSVTTGNGVGGTKIYDFPKGSIQMLGCTADLILDVPAANEASFTDATPEGDVGIGTVAPANADALGTDATDDNLATADAFTMAAFTGAANCPSESPITLNGTATPVDVYVNVLVDAADIDDDTTVNILASGTVTIYWLNAGAF